MVDLERFRSGDRGYHGELARRYGKLVLGIALAYTRDFDWAQDLFQEIWIRVIEKRKTYKGRGSFRGWLNRLATNYCRNEVRGKKVKDRAMAKIQPKYLIDVELDSSETTETEERWRKQLTTRLRHFHAAMAQLPDREYEAIRLRNFQRLPTDVIAERMGIKRATVRSQIRHGYKRLRKILEGMEDDLSDD